MFLLLLYLREHSPPKRKTNANGIPMTSTGGHGKSPSHAALVDKVAHTVTTTVGGGNGNSNSLTPKNSARALVSTSK
jgi:hypothetical protein